MKRTYLIGIVACALVVGTTSVFAVAPSKDDKQADRDAKKTERDAALADKKAAIDEKIEQKKEDVAEKKVAKLCERVQKTVERVRTQMQSREQKGLEKLDDRRMQIQEHRTTLNSELEERRQERDQQREQFYQELMDAAQTDEQMTAVETFKDTVEEAVTVRRSAIDVATETMRTQIDALADERIAMVEELYLAYQEQEDAALEAAEGACGDDATENDLKGIAQDLNAQLKQARNAFRDGVQEQRMINKSVQEIAQVRRTAVQNAIQEFTRTMEQAREQLRTSFPIDDTMMDGGEDEDDEDDEEEIEENEEEMNDDEETVDPDAV
jgi:hypothetical protein